MTERPSEHLKAIDDELLKLDEVARRLPATQTAAAVREISDRLALQWEQYRTTLPYPVPKLLPPGGSHIVTKRKR